MSYTPMRQLRVETPPPAKAAKPAKAGLETLTIVRTDQGDGPTLATLAGLAAGDPCNTVSDAFAERAAIIQEGAGVPADWAEGLARLEAMPVPRGVDAAAWIAMLDAAGRFLDQWGGKVAALGWRAGELFGLDADAPMNRRDRRGAAFYLVGAEVLAVTADAITLKMGGAVQSIRRRPGLRLPRPACGPEEDRE